MIHVTVTASSSVERIVRSFDIYFRLAYSLDSSIGKSGEVHEGLGAILCGCITRGRGSCSGSYRFPIPSNVPKLRTAVFPCIEDTGYNRRTYSHVGAHASPFSVTWANHSAGKPPDQFSPVVPPSFGALSVPRIACSLCTLAPCHS